MPNEYVNKVIYGGSPIIDLTGDDITAADVLSGKKAHLPSGEPVTGTCTYDADTTDATATAAEILSTKTAYKNGEKLTGTMTNNGAVTGTISTKDGTYTIPSGYHDGSGTVGISAAEQSKLVAANIRSGVTLLGVEGSMSGTEDAIADTTTITPGIASQTVTPSMVYKLLATKPDDWDTDCTKYYQLVSGSYVSVASGTTWAANTYYAQCNFISQVTVQAIPYAETDNAAGGKTATIG